MKNPMDRQLEKRLTQRAVEIGREGNTAGFKELLELLRTTSSNVRRLAASALGKLAWMGVDQAAAVAALGPIARSDPHAQTRQYAIKALKAYGAASQGCLDDLRDMAANAAEKEYLRRDAEAALHFIEEAVQIAADGSRRRCQRCHVDVSAEEFARSSQAFQRTFCDRCFDETFLRRRNFETGVELSKTIEADDGTVVQSRGERQVAEWLTAHDLTYRYDSKYRIIGEFQIRPDFYLPELDVYIEYWGMNTPQYKMSMYKKQMLYQQEGKRLISVYPKDLRSLETLLSAKLHSFGYAPQPSTSEAESGVNIEAFPRERKMLKDLVRQEVAFSMTAQRRGLPAPPLQRPCLSDLPRTDLPDGAEALRALARMPVGEAILRRQSVRTFADRPLSLEALAALLWATQGVREVISPACALRTVPSAGSRHAFETYLVVERIAGLVPGLYRYLPFDHQLAQLTRADGLGQQAALACLGQQFVADAAVTFFWTTVPERMEWRYDRAAHKVIAIDVGHVGQNLYLACEAIGAGTCAIAAYDQQACDHLLGVDGQDEFTIYVAPVG
jgi:SagB-type dehydrogenase family enzyme